MAPSLFRAGRPGQGRHTDPGRPAHAAPWRDSAPPGLLGYKLEDVTHVVISHLHMDHIGGMYMFPNAKFFVGAGELPYAYWPAKYARSIFCLNDIMPARGFDWIELDQDTDLFGDGRLQMFITPGHTAPRFRRNPRSCKTLCKASKI